MCTSKVIYTSLCFSLSLGLLGFNLGHYSFGSDRGGRGLGDFLIIMLVPPSEFSQNFESI